MNAPLIPVILGPTASGKTSVGVELAKLLNGEVISVDSRKVYEGLPIGTAWPEGTRKGEALVVEGIPHYLIGHRPPDRPYSAADFASDADALIEAMLGRKKTPILVGGTGFYFKALEKGLPPLPSADPTFRDNLEKRIRDEGPAPLHRELAAADPAAARSIAANDPHRIIRALEIRHLTGRPFSEWKDQKTASRWKFLVMGLHWAKETLDRRIEERSRAMEKDGMIEEADQLLQCGYAPDCPALASFGYREAVQVLQGTLPRSEFLPLLIKGTVAYAKRQRTWFRTQVKPLWFPCDDSSRKEEISLRMKDLLYSRR